MNKNTDDAIMNKNTVDLPCGVKWCVALTATHYCALHEKDHELHPQPVSPSVTDTWPPTPWNNNHWYDRTGWNTEYDV